MVRKVTLHIAGNDLIDVAYGYDDDADDRAHAVTISSDPGTTTYSYDANGQLLGATGAGAGSEQYAYDANGDRTSASSPAPTAGSGSGYTTGKDNRLLSDGTYTYQYDKEGNRTKRIDVATGQTTLYGYDDANRLTSVTTESSGGGMVTQTVAYAYDARGRRIAVNEREQLFALVDMVVFANMRTFVE